MTHVDVAEAKEEVLAAVLEEVGLEHVPRRGQAA
jgi:hypothetical protein